MHLLSTHLAFEGYLLPVDLDGRKQEVKIDVIIFFPRMPLGCVSDEAQHVISKVKCVELIRSVADKKPYVLIEHLAYEIHAGLKKELPIQLEIMVKIRQFFPSILELKEGICFTFFPEKEQQEKKKVHPWDENE